MSLFRPHGNLAVQN
jgi:hypothetical protein